MMAFTGRDGICSDNIYLIRQRMFRVADIIKNVKYTVLHKDELMIIRSRFIYGRNFLTAFNPDTGAIVWQQDGPVPATTFFGEHIYVFFYLKMPAVLGRFAIIDSKTGRLLKDVDVTAELTEQGFRTADYYFLAKQDNYLYIASGYGKSLYAFNIDTAKIEWKQPVVTEAGWISDLKLYNDRLFVTDESDNLHVFKRT
ncbi:PQQ-binding-like beta-propeller repeat protein [Chitinophaga sp. CC14]|uniref:outer membrane protein assembly factor BamB family protein n=1 Tax=Chitinophaga sp. CC14 TaxID=3029199 RepID=UPI003B7C8DF2